MFLFGFDCGTDLPTILFVCQTHLFYLWQDFIITSYTNSSLWSCGRNWTVYSIFFYHVHRMLNQLWRNCWYGCQFIYLVLFCVQRTPQSIKIISPLVDPNRVLSKIHWCTCFEAQPITFQRNHEDQGLTCHKYGVDEDMPSTRQKERKKQQWQQQQQQQQRKDHRLILGMTIPEVEKQAACEPRRG